MSVFKPYEAEVVRTLALSALSSTDIEQLIATASLVSYEYTRVGYFLTVKHPVIPKNRVVCNRPILSGKSGNVDASFVLFLENGELTFECCSCGNLPEDFREHSVHLSEIDAHGTERRTLGDW
jgi:hypothetical protein